MYDRKIVLENVDNLDGRLRSSISFKDSHSVLLELTDHEWFELSTLREEFKTPRDILNYLTELQTLLRLTLDEYHVLVVEEETTKKYVDMDNDF